MRQHRSLPIGIVAICGLMAGLTAAQAGAESWVSGTGHDVGTCPITAPCRTFAYAHGQTTANGAINVLTSGNFGPVNITKAISIVADGVEAVINTGAGGAGITVQVPATAIVSLRGLTIDLRGTVNVGINFVSGAALHLHDSFIRKTGSHGLLFQHASGTKELYVANSVFTDINSFAIQVNPTGGAANVVLDRVRVENAFIGFSFDSNAGTVPITATVRDSVLVGNESFGISANGGGAAVNVMVHRTASVNNGTGIGTLGASATIRIGDSTVTGNGTGLSTSGGQIISYGTNKVNGNGSDGAPSSTIAMK